MKRLDEFLTGYRGVNRELEIPSKNRQKFYFEVQIYHDFWMDNALENFYRILSNIKDEVEGLELEVELSHEKLSFGVDDFEEFKKALILEIQHKYKNMIVMSENKETGIIKEVKKDFILLQEGKKEGGIVKLKEKVYDWNELPKILDIVFNSAQNGQKRCIMCGRTYKKGFELKQGVYPLVTKTKSLSGVRTLGSLPEYHKNLCPLCYLFGVLEWTDEAIVYRTLDNDIAYLFLPLFESLKELNLFKESTLYSGILNRSGRYTNLLVKPNSEEYEKTPGEYTTLLAFYEKFIQNASENACQNWAVLHIPLGKVKNVKLETIRVREGILSVINELIQKDQLPYQMLKGVFFNTKTENGYQANWDFTNEVREGLAKTFLFDNFREFSKLLLPRKGGFVSFSSEARVIFEELIYLWRWRKLGIPKEKLDVIRSVGNIVAKLSLENPSLLYKLDRTRNLEEFWSVLREISRKVAGLKKEELKEIKPTALDDLVVLIKENENIWKEFRDLLVVYSSMYLAVKKLKQGGGNP